MKNGGLIFGSHVTHAMCHAESRRGVGGVGEKESLITQGYREGRIGHVSLVVS